MPQSQSKSRTIDGVCYEVHMLPPRTAMQLISRLGKIIGPALKAGGKESDTENALLAAIGAALEIMDEQVLTLVSDKLAAVSHADGMPLDKIFDVHFIGRMGAWVEWIAFALHTQLSGFGPALANASELVLGLSTEA